MTGALTQVIVWLNAVANALGGALLAPIALLPGWLSATLAAMASGVLFLFVFKYTSNQRAIRRVRRDINANLLALKLFKESAAVSLRAQGRLMVAAGRLFVLALVPMLVMALPATLVLAQLSLWYQARPLKVGEEAIVALELAAGTSWPDVQLAPSDAVEVLVGPVRARGKRAVYWNVRALAAGQHRLEFHVGEERVEKALVVGDGMMRTSTRRPAWEWTDALLYPAEPAFRLGSAVRAIEVSYPERPGWASGTGGWVVYWFVVSLVAAFLFRGALKVHV